LRTHLKTLNPQTTAIISKKELQKDKRKSFGPSSSVTGETKITNYGTKGEREGGQGREEDRERERQQITNTKFY
jgi:hypothetical protein